MNLASSNSPVSNGVGGAVVSAVATPVPETTSVETLTLSVENSELSLGSNTLFSIAGGVEPYSVNVSDVYDGHNVLTSNSGGTIQQISGISGYYTYSAPSSVIGISTATGSVLIEVTDSEGYSQTVYSTINLTITGSTPSPTTTPSGTATPTPTTTPSSTLVLFAPSNIVAIGNTLQFHTSGGTSPYTYSISSGSSYGRMSTSGLFTALGSTAGVQSTVTVTDSSSTPLTTSMTITLVSGYSFTQNQITATSPQGTGVTNLTNGKYNQINSNYYYVDTGSNQWSTGYSYTTSTPLSSNPYVELNLNGYYPIDTLKIVALGGGNQNCSNGLNSIFYNFPVAYEIKYLSLAGSWVSLGTFNDQPNFEDTVLERFGTIVTNKVAFIATSLQSPNPDGTSNFAVVLQQLAPLWLNPYNSRNAFYSVSNGTQNGSISVSSPQYSARSYGSNSSEQALNIENASFQYTVTGGSGNYIFTDSSKTGTITTGGVYTAGLAGAAEATDQITFTDTTYGISLNLEVLNYQISNSTPSIQNVYSSGECNSADAPIVMNYANMSPTYFFQGLISSTAAPAKPQYLHFYLTSGGSYPIASSIHMLAAGCSNGTCNRSFPIAYDLYARNGDGVTWTHINGTSFTTQPDFDGIAQISFNSILTKEIVLVATQPGPDPENGNALFFDMAKVCFNGLF